MTAKRCWCALKACAPGCVTQFAFPPCYATVYKHMKIRVQAWLCLTSYDFEPQIMRFLASNYAYA